MILLALIEEEIFHRSDQILFVIVVSVQQIMLAVGLAITGEINHYYIDLVSFTRIIILVSAKSSQLLIQNS